MTSSTVVEFPAIGPAARVAAALAGTVQTALQPIVDLATGNVVGVESLARFSDERSPEAWFAEAESVGLGVELEIAFVRAGLARLSELPPHAYITLNVSPAAAASLALADALAEAPRGRVVLEITEHCAVVDYASLESALAGFRQGGIRIAVDDAGAGFASLRHVLLLRPDVVKLDGSLTRGIDADPQRRALVAAMVAFARKADCTLVAEGIETPEELDSVRALGVQCGQGFHLGRPAIGLVERWLVEMGSGRAFRKSIRGRKTAGIAAVAAAMVFPAMMAVAGPKPDASVQQRRPPATVSRVDSGGSVSASVASERPATATISSAPEASAARTAASAPAPATTKPKAATAPSGAVCEALCTTVDNTAEVVGGVTQSVVETVEQTVQRTTKLVGGTLRKVTRLLGG